MSPERYEHIQSFGHNLSRLISKQYWLSVENSTLAPDGYERFVFTFNGTIPGPAIIADWGDNLVIHVTNNLEHNGTAIHWHGIRQLNNVEYDGVPGVTQCPIAPGESMTYKFQATQYGSTWYHSHFTQQYGDGLLGPLIINGPATADYDEDLGLLFLSDWSHTPACQLWDTARLGAPPTLETGLINGTNTWDCSSSSDATCIGGGKKFETVFEAGKKYRLRIINTAIEGHFQFSIDGHNLTVISNDLVPIVPYETESVLVSIGQRYDVIVEANAVADNYWLRAGWVTACSRNSNAANITGIVRYDNTSTADPTSTGITVGSNCGDEPLSSLVPYLAMNVGNYTEVTQEALSFTFGNYFTWTINSSSLYLNWSDPTTLRIYDNETIFPTDYNVVPIDVSFPFPTFILMVLTLITASRCKRRVGNLRNPRQRRNRPQSPPPPPRPRLLGHWPSDRGFRSLDQCPKPHQPSSSRRRHPPWERLPRHRVQERQPGLLASALPYCLAC